MKGDDRLLSFNYLDVLSALEQECRDLGDWRDPVHDEDRQRIRKFGRLRTLIGKVIKVVDDGELQVEVGENVKVRVLRTGIAEVRARGEPVKTEAK